MKKLILSLFLATLAACAGNMGQSPVLAAKKEELKKIATAAKQNGDFTNAANLDSQIINLDAKDATSFINLAKTLQKQKNSAAALDILETGEKLLPESEELRLAAAMSLVDNNQADEALAKLDIIKVLRNRDYFNTLGVANDMAEEHEEAQIAFKKGLLIAPDDGLLLNNLAVSYIMSQKYDSAIRILKDLVKRPHTKVKYRQNLALAYGLSDKPNEARKLLLKDMSKKDAEENLKTYQRIRKESE